MANAVLQIVISPAEGGDEAVIATALSLALVAADRPGVRVSVTKTFGSGLRGVPKD